MAFLLNPYEADLDLSDKEDRKLFAEASKGLKDGNLFDGKRENFSTFSKLIEKEFHNVRIMQCLNIPTLWNVGAGTVGKDEPQSLKGWLTFSPLSEDQGGNFKIIVTSFGHQPI